MAITITTGGQMTVTDSTTGIQALQKQLSQVMTGTSFSEAQTISIGTSATSLTLPLAQANFVYIKNLHASQTVTVSWTPTGGSSATIATLGPGNLIVLAGANGVTAVSLTASGASTPVEYIIGG